MLTLIYLICLDDESVDVQGSKKIMWFAVGSNGDFFFSFFLNSMEFYCLVSFYFIILIFGGKQWCIAIWSNTRCSATEAVHQNGDISFQDTFGKQILLLLCFDLGNAI